MVRPSGFEPETARLEGECSIQLSYERIKNKNSGLVVRQRGLEPLTLRSEV
ncbi:conserved hypothetical protein [Sulfurovum sp. enrichment culture clone C5]|uniref:Uncharacterized protein n=1 Tax=Sulfurovum sp. enrichment culture clone C5 TaxID=497650 RepID=A0A0S4XM71_9BACT|nr:conserved hypothetical protein [Sulfurovum sp. enrichment culture clone C5]